MTTAPFGPGLPPALTDDQKHQYRTIYSAIASGCWDPARAHLNQILKSLGRDPLTMPILEAIVTLPDLFLQASVSGFEYPRKVLPSSLHFIGALPPAGVEYPPFHHGLRNWTERVARFS